MTATLEKVRDLLPEIDKRAEETERGRGLSDALLDGLRAAGCLRMRVPAAHGGDELSMPDTLRVVESLATADGSTGWVVGQIALSQIIIGCAGERLVAEVYAGGPDVCAAGAIAPKGRATVTDGGWRISGRWPFVTGCERAEWVYLNCVLVSGRSVSTDASGAPATRILVARASELTVTDTWSVLGLRGTGSHDLTATNVYCPEHHGLAPGGPRSDEVVSTIAQSSLIVAAVSVGIAAGALAEITGLAAGGKRPALSAGKLSGSPVFQDRLGEAYVQLQAARALLYAEAETGWRATVEGRASTALGRARARATAAQATTLAAQVVDTAHRLGGGTAVYDSSPLQRRLRDTHTATQHFTSGRDSYAVLGAILAGEEVEG